MEILYKPSFLRELKKYGRDLHEEIIDKISEFKNTQNHNRLKVHKLHAELSSYFSFSVNYRYRIIFKYLSKNKAVLVAFGDHNIYK